MIFGIVNDSFVVGWIHMPLRMVTLPSIPDCPYQVYELQYRCVSLAVTTKDILPWKGWVELRKAELRKARSCNVLWTLTKSVEAKRSNNRLSQR